MLLPKALYELMPYAYMSAGIAEISYFKTLIATGSGLLFFVAGSLIWILRSNYRRKDPEVTRKEVSANQGLYELKPFLFIMCGVLTVTWSNNWLVYPAASLLVLFGFYILMLRTMHRGRQAKFSRV
jgi:hypothetical protein